MFSSLRAYVHACLHVYLSIIRIAKKNSIVMGGFLWTCCEWWSSYNIYLRISYDSEDTPLRGYLHQGSGQNSLFFVIHSFYSEDTPYIKAKIQVNSSYANSYAYAICYMELIDYHLISRSMPKCMATVTVCLTWVWPAGGLCEQSRN